MKNPNLAKWQYKEELEGVLLFAQVIEEMLFHHTIDTYKAPALNLHTNTIELRILAYQLMKDRIHSGTIIPIMEELVNRIKNDQVLKEKNEHFWEIYLERIEAKKTNPKELYNVLKSLEIELQNMYWDRIKNKLIKTTNNPKEKRAIIELATAFITEAELRGFSRSYIYFKNCDYFFNSNSIPKKIQGSKQLVEFLNQFDNNEKKWKIIFRGSSFFNEMKKIAKDFDIKVESKFHNQDKVKYSFRENSFLGKSTSFPFYIIVESISAYDPNSARDKADYLLNLLSSLGTFVCHDKDLKISDIALVIDTEKKESTILKSLPNPLIQSVKRQKIKNNKDLNNLVEIIYGKHFDNYSTYQFTKSIQFHRTALQSKSPENQLLDLWASLEGFLPTPDIEENRIKHYVSALLPSLTLTYPEKIFNYISNNLMHCDKKVKKIIDNSALNGSFFEKSVAIIISDDLESDRNSLLKALNKHPLLRNRVFSIYENFKSSKHIKETILAHKQKVAWHIQRIYITRNQIIHSAESLPYIETLVENLHSYLDILFNTISTIGVRSKGKLSIPSALKLLSIREQDYFRSLEKFGDVCNSKNYKNIVFGMNNPVSPFE